jgi:hypothetical protein
LLQRIGICCIAFTGEELDDSPISNVSVGQAWLECAENAEIKNGQLVWLQGYNPGFTDYKPI